MPYNHWENQDKHKSKQQKMDEVENEGACFGISAFFKQKTYTVIMAQGLTGAFPWSSIQWLIPWYEYIGFPPTLQVLLFFCARSADRKVFYTDARMVEEGGLETHSG